MHFYIADKMANQFEWNSETLTRVEIMKIILFFRKKTIEFDSQIRNYLEET